MKTIQYTLANGTTTNSYEVAQATKNYTTSLIDLGENVDDIPVQKFIDNDNKRKEIYRNR